MPKSKEKNGYKGPLAETSLYYALLRFITDLPGTKKKQERRLPGGFRSCTFSLDDGTKIFYATSQSESQPTPEETLMNESLYIQAPGQSIEQAFKNRIISQSYEGQVNEALVAQDALKLSDAYTTTKTQNIPQKTQTDKGVGAVYLQERAKISELVQAAEPPDPSEFDETASFEPIPLKPSQVMIIDTMADYEDDIPIDIEEPVRIVCERDLSISSSRPEKEDQTDKMIMPATGLPRTIRKISLEEIACLTNPVTGERYSEARMYSIAAQILTANLTELSKVQPYDSFLAIPPGKILSIVIDFGPGKLFTPYTVISERPPTKEQREYIERRLGAGFRQAMARKEMTPTQQKEYIATTGRRFIEMERFCREHSKDITVYELREPAKARSQEEKENKTVLDLCQHVIPRLGLATIYSQSTNIVNGIVDYVVQNRGLELTDSVINNKKSMLMLDGMAIRFVGESVKRQVKGYVTEERLRHWRQTDEFRVVELPAVAEIPPGTP